MLNTPFGNELMKQTAVLFGDGDALISNDNLIAFDMVNLVQRHNE